MAWTKAINSNGQKVRHVASREDRTIPYRDWLRTVNTNGVFTDVDMFLWRIIDGEWRVIAITELTRCDNEINNPYTLDKYMDGILDRAFNKEKQGVRVDALAKQLGAKAYYVLFFPEMRWVYVYSFQNKGRRKFTMKEWGEYLQRL